WFGLAKNIRDAVVADAVAAAEIAVRVVVESAPGDAAGILRIGGELIVDTRVANSMLRQALLVVDGFSRIGVADELGIQITGMVGRLQWPAEIVHGEHVFQEFGLLEITYAPRLPRGIELVRGRIGAHVEVVIVQRFVDAHAPQDDAGMIPIAPDHAAHIVDGNQLPWFIPDVLPAGDFFQDQQAHFIASVQEMPRLRVVRGAHNVALQLLAEDLRVSPLWAGRHGLPHKRERLMLVEPPQLDDLAIQLEAMVGKLGLPETNSPR